MSGTGSVHRPLFSKSGSLNASVQVESLSKETIVKPSLLDYLEKAFEPIIMKEAKSDDDALHPSNMSMDNESTVGTGSMLSSSGSSLYSFPVDVVVLIRVQPSDIRFSCYPVSKVECLLRIPSLDFAITSTPPIAQPPDKSGVASPGTTRKRSASKPRTSVSSQTTNPPSMSGSNTEPTSIKSGVSFTACLAKFSFCIFHPYGKQYGSSTDGRSSSSGMFSDRRKDTRGSRNQQMSGRDSLSLNVEFIKFNFSRNTFKNLEDQKTSVQISGKTMLLIILAKTETNHAKIASTKTFLHKNVQMLRNCQNLSRFLSNNHNHRPFLTPQQSAISDRPLSTTTCDA